MQQHGLAIQRPRSALHSGDFTQHAPPSPSPRAGNHRRATSPPRSSPSSLPSSSFVYKHPTSPLVQSESNDDDSSIHPMDLDPSSSTPPPQQPSLRREPTFPYQAHQPRKSLTSVPPSFFAAGIPSSSPRPSSTTTRRTSVGLDLSSSPLQQTSMVGSYEESILRGRMSTTPSKPLDFLAQIGVLGLGPNCKGSLRCPAHVTLPFPAVFYSYASTPVGRSGNEDGPSPYVGQVDLENGLPNPEETSRAAAATTRRRGKREESSSGIAAAAAAPPAEARSVAKQRRRTGSGPKAPPGGSYRIPEKGQLQIIIKNQNKTAVKLFLVPYDLTGMEPGTKTFIRQRSYSGGPIIVDDGGGGQQKQQQQQQDEGRPVLRYLVHLHICCPARGRFYLYKSIRVVFANRVPDGKEKLRNEVTLPEPRFTPYKPIRVMHPPLPLQQQPTTNTSSSSLLAADKASRRRSSGFSFAGGGAWQGGQQQQLGFPGSYSPRARAASVQDRGAGVGWSPLPVMESPPTSSFAPLEFAKNGYGHHGNGATGGGGGGTTVDGEGLLSKRLRSLGVRSMEGADVGSGGGRGEGCE